MNRAFRSEARRPKLRIETRGAKHTFFQDLPPEVQVYAKETWTSAVGNHHNEKAPERPDIFGVDFFDYRLVAGDANNSTFKETWADALGRDLRTDVIPDMAREYKETHGKDSKMPILVTGAGLGFANDQIRRDPSVGNDVLVFGTNLESNRLAKRKKDLWESIRQGTYPASDSITQAVVDTTSPNLHQHDRMWPHVLQISRDRKFPLIVDVGGDIHYAANAYYDGHPELFEATFSAAVELLDTPGRLMISFLPSYDADKFVKAYCAAHPELTLTIEKNTSPASAFIMSRFVIDKHSKK